jgi:uncharacterized protein YndB with AHSA1/START domain
MQAGAIFSEPEIFRIGCNRIPPARVKPGTAARPARYGQAGVFADLRMRKIMTRIVTEVGINRPIGDVFDYITTPANWPKWHPASRSVRGAVDHSLLPGEQVAEEFVVGGRAGSCVWQVTKREAPYLWAIAASTPQGGAEICYRLARQGEGTLFERELKYSVSGVWFEILDSLLMRRRMRRESCIALGRLKVRLERTALRDAAIEQGTA